MAGSPVGSEGHHACDEQHGHRRDRDDADPPSGLPVGGVTGNGDEHARDQPEDRVDRGDREQEALLEEVRHRRYRKTCLENRSPAERSPSGGDHQNCEQQIQDRRRYPTDGGDIDEHVVGAIGKHGAAVGALVRRRHAICEGGAVPLGPDPEPRMMSYDPQPEAPFIEARRGAAGSSGDRCVRPDRQQRTHRHRQDRRCQWVGSASDGPLARCGDRLVGVGPLARCGDLLVGVGRGVRCGELLSGVRPLARCGDLLVGVGRGVRCGELLSGVRPLARCGDLWSVWGGSLGVMTSRPVVNRATATTSAPTPRASHAARVPLPISAAVASAVDNAAAPRQRLLPSPIEAATLTGRIRHRAAPRNEADPYEPASRADSVFVSISGCQRSIAAYSPRAMPEATTHRTNRARRSGSASREPATKAAKNNNQVSTPRFRSGVPIHAYSGSRPTIAATDKTSSSAANARNARPSKASLHSDADAHQHPTTASATAKNFATTNGYQPPGSTATIDTSATRPAASGRQQRAPRIHSHTLTRSAARFGSPDRMPGAGVTISARPRRIPLSGCPRGRRCNRSRQS